jgi:hypothetical protein
MLKVISKYIDKMRKMWYIHNAVSHPNPHG